MIGAFDSTTVSTRGFTGHEMIDSVDLVHMNGRIYDPEIGRFLSADPFVQEVGNLQSMNRYSYVLNNPLSFTDPSGFFFSKLFKSIGNFFSSIFRAVGNVLKQALKNGILRSLITIIGCALPGVGQIGCAAISGLVTLASGGSIGESLKAFAFAWVSIGIFQAVGPTLNAIGGVGGALIKAGVHGIIGGALSVAQGGSFLQGFAGSAIGALGGYLAGNSGLVGEYGDGNNANILGRALISGAAGCLGAVVTGGKCAQAALTAAFASMYNGNGLDKGWHSSNVSKVGTLGSAAAMSAGWLFGIGPTYYEYGPETPQSIEMGQARSVSAARELYYRKN
jgi:RHS repeat-associated protein